VLYAFKARIAPEVLCFHLQATMTCAQPKELSRVSLVVGARRAPRSEPLAIEAKSEVGASATERCRLDLAERHRHPEVYALHRDLLRLRRQGSRLAEPTSRWHGWSRTWPARVRAALLRGGRPDRLVIVNFGRDLQLEPTPEPLLAPPEYMRWETLWSREDPPYGGLGTPPLEDRGHWRILGETAVVMFPRPVEDTPHV
jgi:Domain of unknown function (DUF3459)